MRNTFGKNERLKNKIAIANLYEKGRHINQYPIKIVWKVEKAQDSNDFPAKVVLSVSKKKFKKAVDRNRVKRLLKETYRVNKNELVSALKDSNLELHFFLVYLDKNLPEYHALENKIKTALQRLINEINESWKDLDHI